MPRSKDELKAYIEDLSKEKGLDATQTAIAVAAATGDTEALKSVDPAALAAALAPIVDLTVGRQSDYSKAMDAARADQKKAQDHFARLEQWRTGTVNPQVAALQEKVSKFEAQFGALDDVQDAGGGKSVTASGDVVKTADVEKLKADIQQKISGDFLAYESERSELAVKHFELFKTVLDTRPLLDVIQRQATDISNPRILTLTEAYQAVHGTKVAELETKAHDDEIAAAEKRGEDRARKAALIAGAGRSGASIPSGGAGEFWGAINRDGKGAADKLSDADRASLFSNDLMTTSAQNEADLESRINNNN